MRRSAVRQRRKNKTKLERRLRDANIDDFIAEADETEDDFEIVRKKAVLLKPESVEEAILQMNMLGHQFYLFNNSEDDTISVVYRRKDGGYGLLSPEKD